ncbi:MAG: excinuclease ABC subunit UvrC [Bacillota bacterium]
MIEIPPDLPDSPGVYLFKDASGKVIYVGKAVSLKNRVKHYFQEVNWDQPKVRQIVANAASLEFVVTDSEVEALILENNLIKKHRPRYNVKLRDDKNYPYVRVTVEEEWPRVVITRRMKKDGSRYFGPYTSSSALRDTLKLLRRLFPYRTCSDSVMKNATRPCLDYHIKRCLGPCTGNVSKDEYREVIVRLIKFLEGKYSELRRELVDRMREASSKLEFERAAKYRDLIKSIDAVLQKQKVSWGNLKDLDVVGIHRAEPDACAAILQVREGKLVGREQLFLTGVAGEKVEDLVAALLKLYYPNVPCVPPEIVVPAMPPEHELGGLSQYIPAKITTASSGVKKQLLQMAEENARHGFEQSRPRHERLQLGLMELGRLLGLEGVPRRLEGFDISNIQGKYAVASMVVFLDGLPSPSRYRRFRMLSPGPDDYAMMYETLRRRLGNGDLPDLIVIDGGPGQLSAGLRAREELGLAVPMIALAKGEELVYTAPSQPPLRLEQGSRALLLLQSIRDEAHRFAVSYHRALRGKSTTASVLEEIPGIGPKRRAALLKRFGSLEGLRNATVEELQLVPGISASLAERIKEYLG